MILRLLQVILLTTILLAPAVHAVAASAKGGKAPPVKQPEQTREMVVALADKYIAKRGAEQEAKKLYNDMKRQNAATKRRGARSVCS